jgi:hypothetical protein
MWTKILNPGKIESDYNSTTRSVFLSFIIISPENQESDIQIFTKENNHN